MATSWSSEVTVVMLERGVHGGGGTGGERGGDVVVDVANIEGNADVHVVAVHACGMRGCGGRCGDDDDGGRRWWRGADKAWERCGV